MSCEEESTETAPGRRQSSALALRPRILVAIASFGVRNIGYLQRMIQNYQALPFPADVVVLSEAPKDLPPDVRVAVGLPSKNPWSLPFAHKQLFADNVEKYDLFIYSEDDIGVTEANIRAFMSASAVLQDDEIAGFLRYEKDASGTVWMPDAHSMFRWDPASIVERKGRLFASYTNEHSAFFLMTRAQLKRAMASGGFLREPYEGKYDMLCAAATDPYTSCGMRKLVCISELESFLIHHMSDRYAGQMGQPLDVFAEQLQTLRQIRDGRHPATTLCAVESKIDRGEWSKGLYEKPSHAALDMIPPTARTVLSIGCGWGATEELLVQRGVEVMALPLDSVIGAVAEKRGVKIVYGDFKAAFAQIEHRRFDCVLVTNLLHLQREPQSLFSRCLALVAADGCVVIESPNFQQASVVVNRLLGKRGFASLRTFADGGVSTFGPGSLGRWAKQAGFGAAAVRWFETPLPKGRTRRRLPLRSKRLEADGWVFRATRRQART